MHHGILGQRWGVRRYQNADGSLTSAGRERYASNNSEKGSANTLAYLAAYATFAAAVAVGKTTKDAAVSARAKNMLLSRAKRDEVDPKTGLYVKPNKESTQKEDLRMINPFYKDSSTGGTNNNCTLCSLAYDMRRRGFDVTAQLQYRGETTEMIKSWYKNSKVDDIDIDMKKIGYTKGIAECKNSIRKSIDVNKGYQRGFFMCTWAGGFGGHAMAYEVQDGQLKILDGQTNKIIDFESRKMDKLLFHTDGHLEIMRTDNLQPNWKEVKKRVA